MKTAIPFLGGLGDIAMQAYCSHRYNALHGSGHHTIITGGHRQPYATELFLWHPNAHNFTIINATPQLRRHKETHHPMEFTFDDLGYHFAPHELLATEPPLHATPGTDPNCKVVWYPSRYYSELIQGKPYILIAPYAGHKSRNLPKSFLQRLIYDCEALDIPIVLVGRDCVFPNTYSHHTHVLQPPVPDSFFLTKHAAMVICASSAITQVAWFERRRTHVLYPDTLIDFTENTHYAWGRNLPDTTCIPFSQITPSLVTRITDEYRTSCLLDN